MGKLRNFMVISDPGVKVCLFGCLLKYWKNKHLLQPCVKCETRVINPQAADTTAETLKGFAA